ncbi:hypothetical protein OEZ71_05085 [Defluviimonas sp. WL0050]|uniref:MYXO-CTERM domain-containing protein n=1 Tax=Albidovulum litorale TaxID=2984134 RepID=A0ABT2ZKL1_9RHOB|nr:hypothetical protein [Defluviimonas sp. WL0050]
MVEYGIAAGAHAGSDGMSFAWTVPAVDNPALLLIAGIVAVGFVWKFVR